MGKRVLEEHKRLKQGLNHATNFYAVHRDTNLIKIFGCDHCFWRGTKNCPHGLLHGQRHANRICADRMKYLKEQLNNCGTVPKIIQQEELFKLKQISDKMVLQYAEEDDLNAEFKHISKLIVSLTDKMRRQDEGIKLQGEFTVAHEDFKKLVETEAKKIEERNNRTRPGEFTEEVQDSGQKARELDGLPKA